MPYKEGDRVRFVGKLGTVLTVGPWHLEIKMDSEEHAEWIPQSSTWLRKEPGNE